MVNVLGQRKILNARRNVREAQVLIREAVLQINAPKVIHVLGDPNSKLGTRRVLQSDCARDLLITSMYWRGQLELARETVTREERNFILAVFQWIRSLRKSREGRGNHNYQRKTVPQRSEERRVGKECRSRMST